MCEVEAGHTIIYVLISSLAIGVIFLILVSLMQLKLSRDVALQVKYLEGSTDLIFQGQQENNKTVLAFIEKVS